MLQLVEGASECLKENKPEVEKAMTSAVVDRILKIDKLEKEEDRQAAEKEAKAILGDVIEDSSNWSKE